MQYVKSASPFLFGLLLSFCVSSNVSAITILDATNFPSVSDQDYIDLGATYDTVGRLTGGTAGSGTLVASNWVLTAAHVAHGSIFTLNGTSYDVIQSIKHENYNGSTLAYDIALLQLDNDVVGITPATLWTQGDTTYIGNEGSFAGYGKGGDGATGETGGTGTLRGATNNIDDTINETHFISDFDNNTPGNNRTGTKTASNLEGSFATGDSGGAYFYNDTLVGVISAVNVQSDETIGEYGTALLSTRVDLFSNDWITATINAASPVPEPSTYALISALGVLLFAYRRRKVKQNRL